MQIEYFDNRQHTSAVVTREFSDWSVVPLAGNPANLWLRVIRNAEVVEIFYLLDGQDYILL